MQKIQVMGAAFWSLIEMFGRQGVALVTTFLLARLLLPEEFGAAALIAIVASLAGIFVDGGFSYALIQKRDATEEDLSSVFWFNLLVATCAAAGLCLAAEPVAALLGAQSHATLVYPFALSIAVSAASSVHLAMLNKRMDYRRLTFVNTAASVLSGLVAIGLAAQGFGVWALGVQAFINALVSTLLLWWIMEWRPLWRMEINSLRRLFRFGSFMFLSALLDKTAYGVQTALIGRSFGPRDVGFYTKAEGTLNIPQSVVMALVGRVLFPLFSSIAHDPARMLRGLRQAMRLALFINAPFMLGLSVCSTDIIRVLLGPNWVESAPLLSVLALAGLLWPIHAIHLNVLSSQGRSDLFFGVEMAKKLMFFPAMVLASQFGVHAMAWAAVAVTASACMVTTWLVARQVGYRLRQQLGDTLPTAVVAGVMAAAVAQTQPLLVELTPMIRLALCVTIGAAAYAGVGIVVRLPAVKEILDLVHTLRTHA